MITRANSILPFFIRDSSNLIGASEVFLLACGAGETRLAIRD
jgi:hypothetical protein